tara:strand:+ start:2371 stop:2556 length:186 start_codon:yes stop_codon:yes gene_type:complete
MGKIKRYKHMLMVIAYSYSETKPKSKEIEKYLEDSVEGLDIEASNMSTLIDRSYRDNDGKV